MHTVSVRVLILRLTFESFEMRLTKPSQKIHENVCCLRRFL
ncbi:unnamed protein product [Chondrus crispus]|uniref:Uncharacterized protein n=1 Tax=Chondrus crispus TaxID=2769 RepID=R7Q142_CHOCR|nr:unnamed protein product [Chondrus crispus]CDF32352.1 unnamed protein product [Chondrus crispus]|eukprot:XP_005712017.1 unnamed protein product [Chondrus crispus]